MQRRKFIAGLGSLAAAGAAGIGTGAFSTVRADRNISVRTTGDASAYLGLSPVDGQYVTTGNNTVAIEAHNLNKNATTTFEAFEIQNNGNKNVRVIVDASDVPSGYGMSGFTGPNEPAASMVTESNGTISTSDGVILTPGSAVTFTANFDVGTPSDHSGELTVLAISDDAQGSYSDDGPSDTDSDVPTIDDTSSGSS